MQLPTPCRLVRSHTLALFVVFAYWLVRSHPLAPSVVCARHGHFEVADYLRDHGGILNIQPIELGTHLCEAAAQVRDRPGRVEA